MEGLGITLGEYFLCGIIGSILWVITFNAMDTSKEGLIFIGIIMIFFGPVALLTGIVFILIGLSFLSGGGNRKE